MPREAYSFEVIKDGVVVSNIDLSERAHYVIGRHKSTAHVVLEHPSISRQHVIVQHRDDGEVYLYDCGSTHGTFCNKGRLPAREHVLCPVGSTVKLGQSTRLLCLLGPAREEPTTKEREREAKRSAAAAQQRMQARAEVLAKRTGKSLVKAEDLHTGGAGWGFDDEAVEERASKEEMALGEMGFEQLYAQAKAKGLNMTPRQERLVEQLEKRSEKLANLTLETEKIQSKEWEGLSEGQKAQVSKNEARSETLKGEISALQDQIADSIREQIGAVKAMFTKARLHRPSPSTHLSPTPLTPLLTAQPAHELPTYPAHLGPCPAQGQKKRTAADEDYGEGDDDFFDRTEKRGKAAKRGAAATAQPAAAPAPEPAALSEQVCTSPPPVWGHLPLLTTRESARRRRTCARS